MVQIFDCSTFLDVCHENKTYVQEKNKKLLYKVVDKHLPGQDLSHVFQQKSYAEAVNIIAHKIKDQVADFDEHNFAEHFAHNESWYSYEHFRMSDEC